MRRPPARASPPLTPFLLLVLTLMSSTLMNALEEPEGNLSTDKVPNEPEDNLSKDKALEEPRDSYREDKAFVSEIDNDTIHLISVKATPMTALEEPIDIQNKKAFENGTVTKINTYTKSNGFEVNYKDKVFDDRKVYKIDNDTILYKDIAFEAKITSNQFDNATVYLKHINHTLVNVLENPVNGHKEDHVFDVLAVSRIDDHTDIKNMKLKEFVENNQFIRNVNSSNKYIVSLNSVNNTKDNKYLNVSENGHKNLHDDTNNHNKYDDDVLINVKNYGVNVTINKNNTSIFLHPILETNVNKNNSSDELKSIKPNLNIDQSKSKSKEYQSLFKGVRKKENPVHTTETNLDKTLTSNYDHRQAVNFHGNYKTTFAKADIASISNLKDTKQNVSMEKLIDDETRAKIYHDYSKTISKNKDKLAEANTKTITDGDVVETNSTFDNKDYTDNNLTTEVSTKESTEGSQVTLLSRMQTPRPNLVNELIRNTTSRMVSILGLFELTVGDIPRADGLSELAAARLAVDHVNKRGVLPGYQLTLVTNDTKCDPGVGVDRFFHALYTERSSRMVMLLGTACSDVTESIAKIVPYWNIVQVSFGATSPALSDRSEFPLFCRTVAPDSSHNPARIAFIRQLGWDTVTAFTQNEEVYSLAVNELVTQLEAANITCAASITFAETDFKQQLLQLKELDTRIIIGSFSQEMIPKIFCEAFRLGMWGAEYAWLVAGAPPNLRGSTPCSRSHLTTALEGLVTVTAYKGAVDDEEAYSGLSMQTFHREMQLSGASVSTFAPQTYDAVWAIALALSRFEQHWRSSDNKDVRSKRMGLAYFDYDRKDMAEQFLGQLANLSFLGVSGPVSFNGADRIGTTAFHQIQGGRPRIVALYTNGLQLQCPECSKPEWAGGIPAARRVLVLRVDSVWPPARLAIAVLAMAGVALALAFLLFNLHYSKRRSIKLSSPRLNNMTLIGCVLVYTAVALLGLDNATLPSYVPFSAMCTGRVYILSAGFSLAFGSMFAKTYRVHRIFVSNRSGVCKTKLLQDTPLISLVCALLVIDGLIVTLWATLDPMERHLKNLTVEISATDRSVVYQPQIEVCKSQNTTGWLCALYAYKGLLLIVGVYMAWETRNVKISALNDSKYIGISVYSVVITSTSVVVIGTIISERATLAYITITSLILITTTSTLCLLFLPKIIAIRSNTEDDPVIQSLGLKLECKTRRFVTDDTQELHFRIEIQNKVYKREVAALDKEIGRLEKLLAEPLETTSDNSISMHRRTELNTVEEESHQAKRTPSITDGLPMLLLSVLPPVIPRASWPSAESCRGRNSISFSSQPKLDYRKSQPTIDFYNLCMRREEQPGFLRRLKSFFGSRSSSRKASTVSIADPTNQSIATALKMHVGMIAGLVPGNRKHSMVLSCNTLHVPHPESKLRRESFARSGPIIRVTDDEPSCSNYLEDRRVSSTSSHHGYDRRVSNVSHHFVSDRRKSSTSNSSNRYVSEPETKVNFVLPVAHKALSHENSAEKIKGSPRFPHRITPRGSLTTLDKGKSAESVFNISGKICEEQRRYSHQNVVQEKCEVVLETRWRSTDDARPGTSGALD